VFAPFTQAASSTMRRFGGSGLGLSISKRLVELIGGRIWIEGQIDKGGNFAFAVPFEIWLDADRPGSGPAAADHEEPLPALNMLMAEGSANNCAIALAYLQDPPYRIEVAQTSAVVCKMFTSGHDDLVLTAR
jgi:hypothetical protein